MVEKQKKRRIGKKYPFHQSVRRQSKENDDSVSRYV
jgi:hypothetical protein